MRHKPLGARQRAAAEAGMLRHPDDASSPNKTSLKPIKIRYISGVRFNQTDLIREKDFDPVKHERIGAEQ